MSACQKNLIIEIIEYGRDLYCHGSAEKCSRWPSNYAACVQILINSVYKDPIIYRVCLNETYYNLWSVNETVNCQYCGQQGAVIYYYLSLTDKVKRWCILSHICLISEI